MVVKFGDLLKQMRKGQRFSQLSLALEADISQRHISFIETARAKASVKTILKIAKALKLDLQNTNQLLLSAGFAPQYTEIVSPENHEYIWHAIDFVLESQMPYPTIVLDEKWNIVKSNAASKKLFVWLMDLTKEEIEALQNSQMNLLDLILNNPRLRPYIKNWAEIATHMASQALADGIYTQKQIDDYISKLSKADQDLFNDHQTPRLGSVIIPLVYQKNDVTLSLISMQTRFMMSQNIALSGLSIESFIANDEITADFFTNVLF
ncbi:MAG: helix-turn-helix transcriptional regulator [Hyphomicrobiales bacterium]